MAESPLRRYAKASQADRMTATRDGEIIKKTTTHIVVRGHLTEEEMQRLTGRIGYAKHKWWRHAYIPYRQRQLLSVPRGRFVDARKPGRGAFAVTVLTIRRSV